MQAPTLTGQGLGQLSYQAMSRYVSILTTYNDSYNLLAKCRVTSNVAVCRDISSVARSRETCGVASFNLSGSTNERETRSTRWFVCLR